MDQPDDTKAEQAILSRIKAMVADEKALREQLTDGSIDVATEQARLGALERELDQCWDLLRQRRAKGEAGEDPGQATVRSEITVEGYTS
ncbi:DUF2630 family protein [Streptomyces sp. SID13666]|uniref:DUF2630 family protein n=1 Tax=Streptomyces TaxID=1883 RepID=UPI0011067877|nr:MULTISPECIES: DUF2630 family protein [Streptomyces]MCZ4095721.1 DUF2630 family protein [Streptomyces sp. H39-C1]NEA54412.1 DUF2630 family protein [Streptomyces sp. SID13666]NEA72213.1 DUF2630 family protein [Streptomyces sp. SID13588]QNA73818.1 DUF2630 family protein [Streptomyces sp. So13.3]